MSTGSVTIESDDVLLSDDRIVFGDTNPVSPSSNIPSAAVELADLSMQRKIQAGHIKNHHGAMAMYLHNASLANRLGLSESQKRHVVPFPSPSNMTFIQGAENDKWFELMIRMIEALKPPQPGTVQAPPDSAPVPAPTPQTPETKSRLPIWVKWLLGALGAAVLGGALYALWPDGGSVPPDIGGEIGVTIR